MKPLSPEELEKTLREASAYIDQLDEDPHGKPDYALLHHYLTALHNHLRDPAAPAKLQGIMAQLYFEAMRYEEAAEVLRQLRDPSYNDLLENIDFLSGYFADTHHWESRQKAIWDIFSELEEGLYIGDREERGRSLEQLTARWDAWVPSDLVLLERPHWLGGQIHMGCPHGIYSLVPMLYLANHVPEEIEECWEVKIDAPDLSVSTGTIDGEAIDSEDILVRVSPSRFYSASPKVNLAVWHPAMANLAASGNGDAALWCANMMVRTALPVAAFCLYVDQITLADNPPDSEAEDVSLLSDLWDWFRSWNMAPYIRPEQILESRKLSFARRPTRVSRPRADIFQGETCMPELEEIYFLRNGKGMAALQRYGVGYWFLTIPRWVTGRDFQTFRLKLEEHVRSVQQDKVFFTGWADGNQNHYIDFLSMNSPQTLSVLQAYLENLPAGEDVRICTFYWNSALRTPDYLTELSHLEDLELLFHQYPDGAAPPEDLVSSADRVLLEHTFRETVWTGPFADSFPAVRTLWSEDEEDEALEEDAIDWGDADWYDEAEDWPDDAEDEDSWPADNTDMEDLLEPDAEDDDDDIECGKLPEPPSPNAQGHFIDWDNLWGEDEDQDEDS